jgi:toxin ParE1/3/4
MNINWADRALSDLDNIRSYYENQGSADAGRLLLLTIVSAAAAIGETPQRGRPGRVAGTRELVVPHTPFIIAYRPSEPRPDILAVIHSARLWPESL